MRSGKKVRDRFLLLDYLKFGRSRRRRLVFHIIRSAVTAPNPANTAIRIIIMKSLYMVVVLSFPG